MCVQAEEEQRYKGERAWHRTIVILLLVNKTFFIIIFVVCDFCRRKPYK